MKNKAIHELTKQHHYDIRTCEENIQRLANDITRIERMFEVLWQEMRKKGADLAITPSKQELKCSLCDTMTNRYHITAYEGGYYKETVCVQCYIDKGVNEES